MDTTHARALLEAELKQLDHDAGTEAEHRAGQVVEDRTDDGMDIADSGSRVAEAMDRDLTVGTLRHRREQMLTALQRLEGGSYGRCIICGRTIDDERLQARPETQRCRDHPEGPSDIDSVEP